MKKIKMWSGIIGVLFTVLTVVSYFNVQTESPIKRKNKFSTNKLDVKRDRAEKQKNIIEIRKWQFERLKDPKTNSIPSNIRQKELSFAKRLPIAKARRLEKGNAVTATWISEGPNNQGGRTKGVIADIANESILLAAAAEGGVWRSLDDGNNWTSTTDPSFIQNVSSIAQDTRSGKTNTWYYGTGEYGSNLYIAGNNLGRFLGNGIFKSTDNGLTWKGLASTQENNPAWYINPFQIIWNIDINESNTTEDEIWASCLGGVYGSKDGGETWPMFIKGAGELSEIPHYTNVAVTAVGGVYAALSSGLNSGIYFSDNGTDWNTITPSFWPAQVDRIAIASAKSNSDILYVLSNTPGVGMAGDDSFNSLWKYDASTSTWTDLSNSLPAWEAPVSGYNSQTGYDMCIEVKPDDENFVIIGGTNLYRTTDGFATKLNKLDWIGGYATSNDIEMYENQHPDQHGFFFLHSDPTVVYSSHDGGISKSNDITASDVIWSNMNNGYVTSQFWHISMDHATANSPLIIGGLQDNGSHVDDESNKLSNWKTVGGGDGTYTAIADEANYFYFSFQFANIYRQNSVDEWAQITPEGASNFLFITPYILDDNNTNVMFLAAGDKVWRNSNLTEIPPFIQAPTDVNWEVFDPSGFFGYISALATTKAVPNLLYIGDSWGQVFKITDASNMNSYFDAISSIDFPPAYISSITVNSTNGDEVLVAFSNYNVLSLFHTNDGGTTWTSVGGNLEENPDGSGSGPSVRNVKILPVNGSIVYLAATSIGLYSTSTLDGENTIWALEAPNQIGNVVVETMDVRPNDGRVIIGTFGKGVYSTNYLTTNVDNTNSQPETFSLSQNYPNPFNPSTRISYNIAKSGNVKLEVFNSLGESVEVLVNEQKGVGSYSIQFRADNLASGLYIYKLTAGNLVKSKKMILTK